MQELWVAQTGFAWVIAPPENDRKSSTAATSFEPPVAGIAPPRAADRYEIQVRCRKSFFDSGLRDTYHARAMANPLLDRWSPQELAERGQVIEKEEELKLFPRVTQVVAEDLQGVPEPHRPARWRQAPVAIRLVFGWADSRRQLPQLTGRVSAQVAAVCQRCLEPFALTLAQELRFLLAWPGCPVVETQGFETWELDEPVVRPLDIVDEALIMALPLSARHADIVECGSLATLLAGDSDSANGDRSGDDKVRPFADLRSRMQQDD